jgi:hypothetical protein
MATASFEVQTYHYWHWSSRNKWKTQLYLQGVGGETCAIWFVEDGTANLPAAEYDGANHYRFFYQQSEFQYLVDMLRHEKPIFVFFDNQGGSPNSRISTTPEPVGEGEEPNPI